MKSQGFTKIIRTHSLGITNIFTVHLEGDLNGSTKFEDNSY